MNESQRRAFCALGIGPLWHLRTAPAQAAAASIEGEARSFFLLPDEAGDWLFVADADDADAAAAAGDAGAGSSEPLRLLERMFVALGLRPAGAVHVPYAARPSSEAARPASQAARSALQEGEPTADDAGDALAGRVAAIAPRVVVALGAAAAQALLRTDAPPAALRGRVHEAPAGSGGVPVVVSWHPSQLLAAPQEKAAAWADLCLAREVADAGVAGRA